MEASEAAVAVGGAGKRLRSHKADPRERRYEINNPSEKFLRTFLDCLRANVCVFVRNLSFCCSENLGEKSPAYYYCLCCRRQKL